MFILDFQHLIISWIHYTVLYWQNNWLLSNSIQWWYVVSDMSAILRLEEWFLVSFLDIGFWVWLGVFEAKQLCLSMNVSNEMSEALG